MSLPSAIDQYEAADVLLKYVFSGSLGPVEDKGVSYALMNTTHSTFTYSAALESFDGPPCPLDRYQITIDRQSRELSVPKKIEITDEDMQKAIFAATGETVTSSTRFTDGSLSISYKVTTKEKPNVAYVVQLRHHGNVASMDALMRYVRMNSEPGVVPMPIVYSIPGEARHQQSTGFGRQITQFVPGVMGNELYPNISHANKLELVREMAQAWQACWELPLPSPRQIGELIGTDNNGEITLTVGPDRHFNLGGPFTSVREWLRARIHNAIVSLERASGIDDFKNEYLAAIKVFADTRLDQIPKSVDEVPIVAMHVDMGLHNVVVSTDTDRSPEIKAIIDWEFCASGPFLAAYDCIERLFRTSASSNGFGLEYPHAEELRPAFWDTIPRWKSKWESQAARDFMEWFRFALFMEPEHCSSQLSMQAKKEFWAENRRVVEGILEKYGVERKM